MLTESLLLVTGSSFKVSEMGRVVFDLGVFIVFCLCAHTNLAVVDRLGDQIIAAFHEGPRHHKEFLYV